MKAAHLKLKALLPTENDEAENLMQWAAHVRVGAYKLSDVLIMIPNGTVLAGDAKHRAIQMARLKRGGFKAGVSDYLLMVGRGGYHGLFLELKRRELGVVSQAQVDFLSLALTQGYASVVCKGFDAAKTAIEAYLS